MTVCSMTGFSTGKVVHEKAEINCEFRSLNSRYLEIYVKLPGIFKDLEDEVKELIRSKINRGKISCQVTLISPEPLSQSIQIDESAVRAYKEMLDKIREVAGLAAPVQLSDLQEFKDIFVANEHPEIDAGLKQALFDCISGALEQLNQNREIEGANLRNDMEKRVSNILKLTAEIKEMGKDNPRIELEKLRERIKSTLADIPVDQARLETELALISDKVDISEETTRLESHLGLFLEALSAGSPVGKKLNFVLQEMHREANTISSKNTLIPISHRVVEMKEEIERIREQVQNIE